MGKKDGADHLSTFKNLLLPAQPVSSEGEGAASGWTWQTAAWKAEKINKSAPGFAGDGVVSNSKQSTNIFQWEFYISDLNGRRGRP